MSHGINANVAHKWRRVAAGEGSAPVVAPTFVPVALPAAQSVDAGNIHIELRRGATSVAVKWPVASSGDSAAWLRELLR